ncbi:hypothetical protein VPH35_020854 [Triticum aestivum]
MWRGVTRPECFRYRVLGLPQGKLDVVSLIRRSAALFLYDFHAKYLYGPYHAKMVRALLAGLGVDDHREGLRRTPKRVAKAFRDGTQGITRGSIPFVIAHVHVRSLDLAPLRCLESRSTKAMPFVKCQYLRNLTRTRFWWFSFGRTF